VKQAVVIAFVVAAIVVPSSSAIELTLVPGVGIGKVRLGMTLAQVKHVLGPPQTTNMRAQLPDRRGYIEYGWNFSTLWVGFVNTKGVLRAVLVGTDLRSEGRVKGVGIGTVRDKLKGALPVVPCAARNFRTHAGAYDRVHDTNKGFVHYCLFGPGGRVTAFDLATDLAKDCHPAWSYENCTWRVNQVLVTGRL
jgi:hypothetical protein